LNGIEPAPFSGRLLCLNGFEPAPFSWHLLRLNASVHAVQATTGQAPHGTPEQPLRKLA